MEITLEEVLDKHMLYGLRGDIKLYEPHTYNHIKNAMEEWAELKVKNLAQPDVSGNEALRVALLAFADHLNTYPKMEDIRFDFMVVDYLDSKQ